MALPDRPKTDRKQRILNLTLASIAAQVGIFTLVIVLGAVFGGLWLDAHFHSKPTFTIILLVTSIPISLTVMFLVVRAAVSRIKTEAGQSTNTGKEEKFGK